MQQHQERVVNESNSLNERLTKLKSFLKTSAFYNLEEAERERLKMQCGYMQQYFDVLQERINNF